MGIVFGGNRTAMMTDIHTALKRAGDLELKMKELYDGFAEVFREFDQAHGLFTKLSEEEKVHHDLIQYQRRLARNSPKVFPDVDVDLETVDRLTDELVEKIGARKTITLREALDFAIDCENSAAEYHHRNLIGRSHPEAGRLVRNLGGSDLEHAMTLREFVQRWEADAN